MANNQAVYTIAEITHHQGNPLIEALPPIRSVEETYKALMVRNPYDDTNRNLPPEIRIQLAYESRRFFKPYARVISLESSISTAIRSGYVARNPLMSVYWDPIKKENAFQRQTAEDLSNGRVSLAPKLPSSPSGLTILGMSGTGKSYSMEAVLNLYPQVIVHQSYNGIPFAFNQISWIKVDCPADGSLKGLCCKILEEIDLLLSTNYYKSFGENGRAAKHTLMRAISRLTRLHGIGCIVIDEIQYLTAAKDSNREDVINFVVELENMRGTPVIKIGTYKARRLFAEFREARRASGLFPTFWNPMREDKEWHAFVNMLWRHQYTKEICILTDEILHLLYEISQGILDIAVKTFIFAQLRAIQNGDEIITPDLLASVALDYFRPAKAMLEALRTNDIDSLERFEDIYIDIDKHYAEIVSIHNQQTVDRLDRQMDQTVDVVAVQPGQNPVKRKTSPKKNSKKTSLIKSNLLNDLRYIVENGEEKGITAYEALKRNGVIKQGDEFLDPA